VIIVNFCFGTENYKKYDFVLDYCVENGFHINLMPIRETGYNKENLSKKLSAEQFMAFSEYIEESRHRPGVKESGIKVIHKNFDLFNKEYPSKEHLPPPFNGVCGAANFGIAIVGGGDSYVCGFAIDDKIGTNNLFEKSMSDVWNSPEFNRFRDIPQHENCKSCEFNHRSCSHGGCKIMMLQSGAENKDSYCFKELLGCD
jgi:MoaA/NifB/PqqE/SkfB family radical SAM enzyme